MKRAFSLIETVIAIGVLAVLLTGFMIVFAPAAAGIKKAISAEEADRLASTLEQELVTSRGSDPTPGFSKAFKFLKEANSENTAMLVYQYRGSLTKKRGDDTPMPMSKAEPNKGPNEIVPGADYVLKTMVRQKSDALFAEDLVDLEGGVYLVKCTQLGFENGELVAGAPGKIVDPKLADNSKMKDRPDMSLNDYPEAVIAFSAEFYSIPGKRSGYFDKAFGDNFKKFKNPVFTRNLAVRR